MSHTDLLADAPVSIRLVSQMLLADAPVSIRFAAQDHVRGEGRIMQTDACVDQVCCGEEALALTVPFDPTVSACFVPCL